MPKKVSILGYGWLGKALAKELLHKTYQVHGSTTTQDKFNLIKADGVVPHILHIRNEHISGSFDAFLAEAAILVVAFPPGLRHDADADYSARINQLLTIVQQHNTSCKILLLSSIGVFGQSQGVVTESSAPKPDSEVGNQLDKAEKAVLKLGTRANIVRLGGLVGDGRHPAKQLSGKKNILHPNALTNLVHQHDVVRFLCAIIEQNIWGHILHCVSPEHQKRKEFYNEQCALAGLEPPDFNSIETKRNKEVKDARSKQLFAFDYELVGCSIQDC